jgi:hypothetical protein
MSGNDGSVSRIADYRFHPRDLAVAERREGVSAFMRVRNGEDFLEPTIRSHLTAFDEIVGVHPPGCDTRPAPPGFPNALACDIGVALSRIRVPIAAKPEDRRGLRLFGPVRRTAGPARFPR